MAKTLVILFSRAGENYVQGRIENLARGNTEVAVEYACKVSPMDVFPDFFISFLAEPLSLLGGRGKKFTLYVAPV